MEYFKIKILKINKRNIINTKNISNFWIILIKKLQNAISINY